MRWHELEPGAYVAEGNTSVYLVWFSPEDGQVRLTRWPLTYTLQHGMTVGAVREAVLHVVVQQVPRGPGRPPMVPDAEALMRSMREQAERYEDGHSAVELGRSDWLQTHPLRD